MQARGERTFVTFAHGVWRDALARDGAPGSARALAQQELLERLLARIGRFTADNPDATLGDVLAWAEERIEMNLHERRSSARRPGFVQLMSVEEARGAEFECVAIANVRPGAFPLWYVPEAFMFSPKLGMVPKENSAAGRRRAPQSSVTTCLPAKPHSATTNANGGRSSTRLAVRATAFLQRHPARRRAA